MPDRPRERLVAANAELEQADRCLRSSKILLRDGDDAGSINRLYYALYHAARAALIFNSIEIPKSHSGLIASFGVNLVKSGKIDTSLGKLLNKVEHERLLSDYSGELPDSDAMPGLFEQAEQFLAAIRSILVAS